MEKSFEVIAAKHFMQAGLPDNRMRGPVENRRKQCAEQNRRD